MTESLNTDDVIEKLNAALPLQQRSPLLYALVAGSVIGFELQALTDRLHGFAEAELADTRRLVEKITALGGDPVAEVAPLTFERDPVAALRMLIECETESLEAMQAVIPETGTDGASEALEHLMEHAILRKQDQIDFLQRALRT
jgi:bacterioferritin (cytochrome b1)